MATKAQSEVKEVKVETKAKPKKTVIKADTIVLFKYSRKLGALITERFSRCYILRFRKAK